MKMIKRNKIFRLSEDKYAIKYVDTQYGIGIPQGIAKMSHLRFILVDKFKIMISSYFSTKYNKYDTIKHNSFLNEINGIIFDDDICGIDEISTIKEYKTYFLNKSISRYINISREETIKTLIEDYE